MTHSFPLSHDPAPRAVRIEIALDDGLMLPEGDISILRPRLGETFGPLPRERLRIMTGFRPDHDGFSDAGFQVSTDMPVAEAALVCLPRSKTEGLSLIALAIAAGAKMVLVDGQKTDGIESVLKAVRQRTYLGGSVSKAHGKLFWFTPTDADFSDWTAASSTVHDPALGPFRTTPGLFSSDNIDPGSALLAQHLPETLPARMADFGAGWGYLAAACLARKGVTELHLVEAEYAALEMARENISDSRAQFHWADACSFAHRTPLDGLVMNPPFHTGRKAQPELGMAFIAAAARNLSNRGKLWMVANRHLPYEAVLSKSFGSHEILAETSAFRVWQATSPRRQKNAHMRIRGSGKHS